jgi:hypothetical protein
VVAKAMADLTVGSERADRGDPAVRAAARLAAVRARHVGRRIAAAVGAAGAAIALPVAAAPVTGDPGATVGGVVGGLLLLAVAIVVWPWEWSREEREYHELDAIWREIRTDADREVAWDRFAAWAEATPDAVELRLLRRVSTGMRLGGAPNPYRRERPKRLDPEDIAAAAEAMEKLRARAASRETLAQQTHERKLADDEQRRLEEQLAAIDESTEAEIRAAEELARQELAAQEAAEREAQAAALARALRRP